MALKLRPNCKKQKICFGVYPLFNFDRFPHKNDKLLKKWITAYSYGTRELVPFKNCRALQKAFLPQWFFSELVFVSKLKKNVFKKRCCPKDFSETPVQKKKELLRNESSGFFYAGEHDISALSFSSAGVFVDKDVTINPPAKIQIYACEKLKNVMKRKLKHFSEIRFSASENNAWFNGDFTRKETLIKRTCRRSWKKFWVVKYNTDLKIHFFKIVYKTFMSIFRLLLHVERYKLLNNENNFGKATKAWHLWTTSNLC